MAARHLGEGALYVEGWIVAVEGAPVVVEHGWCEVEGRVIDPTYTPSVTNLEGPLAYFSGMRLSIAEARAALNSKMLPIAWSRQDSVYREAFMAAVRHAKARRRERAPLPPTRVVHCRREPFDVFIGRTTRWANPFVIGRDGTRREVVTKFREWFIRRPGFLRDVESLRGKILGCLCAPEPCHGDVLAELADVGEEVLD